MDLVQYVTRQLAAWGVKVVFGVAGDDLLPLLDALAREGGLRYVGAAHEAGAAFMATAWAKLTGELGVCLASAAGAVNLAEGLAEAYLDGAPVLAITGQVASTQLGTRAAQLLDQQRLLGTVTAYSQLLTGAQSGVRLLLAAMSQALLRQSPAHLSVPSDLWQQPVEAVPAPLPGLLAEVDGGPGELQAASDGRIRGDVERVVTLMRTARRPLVVAGDAFSMRREPPEDAGRSPGRNLQFLRELASAWGAAVVVAQEVKGAVPETWGATVGGVGEAWVPPVVAECDCVLLVGAAPLEEPFLPPVPIIRLAPYPWEIDDRHLWDSLSGEAGTILRALTRRLEGYAPDHSWAGRIAAAREERARLIAADLGLPEKPVHPARLMAALGRVLADEAIVVLDVGSFMHWFDRDFLATAQTILASSRWRSMGRGIPGAIAAQLRFPGRQVVALVGDGGLLMSLGELATAGALGLPLRVIVVSNRRFGLEADKAAAQGLSPAGLAVPPMDYAACARAAGFTGYTVDDPATLEEALRHTFSAAGPALLDVVCRDVRLPLAGGET